MEHQVAAFFEHLAQHPELSRAWHELLAELHAEGGELLYHLERIRAFAENSGFSLALRELRTYLAENAPALSDWFAEAPELLSGV